MAIDLGSLQRQHPTWKIVDAIAAPNGGIWALGADGGVFSLNGQGGTDGTTAPFFGSYTQLAPEARQGNRTFTKINIDSTTGGYTLVSNQPGQTYSFKGDRPIDTKVDTSQQPLGAAIDFTDADLNQLTATLNQFGLGDLVSEAWAYFKDPTKGAGSADATLAYLPTTQKYRDHFPGLKEMGEAGKAWTPGQWNSYYNTAQEQAVAAGLPSGFISREDVGKLLTGNVSAAELGGRITAAGQSVYNADPVLIQQMRDYGMTDGDLTAFYLDPDKAAPLLERKAQEEQGRIGAAGRRTGYGNVTLGEAQGLQQLGVDEGEAAVGFGQLASLHPLFANTAEETMTGSDITRDEQLGAQFGNNAANQAEIEQRKASRKAAFSGGGGAASGGAGKQGLGGAG